MKVGLCSTPSLRYSRETINYNLVPLMKTKVTLGSLSIPKFQHIMYVRILIYDCSYIPLLLHR